MLALQPHSGLVAAKARAPGRFDPRFSHKRIGSHATFLYMSTTVGIAELRQNLSQYLRLVERGERLVVTDRNRPVAELGPPPTSRAAVDRLIGEGRVSRPTRRGLPQPLRLEGDSYALSQALEEIRGER
jgi:prevent-host-death family protein